MMEVIPFLVFLGTVFGPLVLDEPLLVVMDVFFAVFGVKLEREDAFVLGNKCLETTFGAFSELSEGLMDGSDVVAVVFVHSEVSQLALHEVLKIFRICVVFEGEIDVLETFGEGLGDHFDCLDLSQELMTETNADGL